MAEKGVSVVPIFIVGCGHSGTSLLLSIIGTHSQIYTVPFESLIAMPKYGPKRQRFLPEFDADTKKAGKRRWVEKTPSHIHYIKTLFQLRPKAQVLLILRDGRDVACSIKDRLGDLSGIERWVTDNKSGQKYWDHPSVYVLKYEDIIEDFEKTITGVMDFLGEEYEPEMRDFHKIPRLFYSNSLEKPDSPVHHGEYRNWQINQPLFDGRGRWKKDLTSEEFETVMKKGREMLITCGYIEKDEK